MGIGIGLKTEVVELEGYGQIRCSTILKGKHARAQAARAPPYPFHCGTLTLLAYCFSYVS
jgi:hypothetical protein